jgi:hypothetical protein
VNTKYGYDATGELPGPLANLGMLPGDVQLLLMIELATLELIAVKRRMQVEV